MAISRKETMRPRCRANNAIVIGESDGDDSECAFQKKDRYANSPIRFRLNDDHYELHVLGYIDQDDCPDDAIHALMADMEEANKSMELHIFVNSYGGSVSFFSSILQQVMEFDYRVTVVQGVAASAGFLLWATGDERYVSPYSELMYHDIAGDASGKSSEIRDIGEHMDALADTLQIEILAGRGIILDDDIKRGKRTEVWYVGADFINEGTAKDFREFKDRPKADVACNLAIGGKYYMQYISHDSNQYVEVVPDMERIYTYAEIMRRAFENENAAEEGDGKKEK